MKKYKLFLLGGIISILSIGSFSNAQFISDINYDCQGVLNLKLNVSNGNYQSIKIVNPGSSDGFLVKVSTGFNCESSSCSFKNLNSTFHKEFYFSSLPSNVNYVKFGQVSCGVSYVLSQKSSKMPVSALTPAIDGLRGTIYEIIPYVIYIGIGVLLAILGFYAIRWLVNWMGGKINSYFSSKKR